MLSISTDRKVVTRKEAELLKLKAYFTGLPCKRGHISRRRVTTGKCMQCEKEDVNKYIYIEKIRAEERRKWKEDPIYRKHLSYKTRINELIRLKPPRNTSAMKYLGCELPFFLEYLRLQFFDDMSFDKRNKWELDHIRPVTTFNLEDHNQWSCCWNWRNLRPIPKSVNRKKRERYDLEDELNWIYRMKTLDYKEDLFTKYILRKCEKGGC
tara:strand:+ start:1032 stop:1661 length:630 start_codon:yes stop_codon:yes gene_type:complete